MAKDPAFLFYSDNFMSGTMFFTDEQVGKYIRLLCAQHLTGHLSEKHMLKICGTYDEDIWSKFQRDGAGLFFQPRLEMEIQRRKNYSQSRRKNRQSPDNQIIEPINPPKPDEIICQSYDTTYVNHMENETGNENEIEKGTGKGIAKGVKFIKPSTLEIEEYIFSHIPAAPTQNLKELSVEIFDYYESNGWLVGKNKMKDWQAAVRNWIRRDLNKTNSGNGKHINTGNRKNAGANELDVLAKAARAGNTIDFSPFNKS